MGPVLNALVKLQSVENNLRAAKAKLTRCRRNVIIKENQLRTFQNSLEAKKEEVQLSRIQVDRLELELKTMEDAITKYRAALNTAKNNKDYAAILTELNTRQADASKIENQSLELMRNIDTDNAQCEQIKTQIEQEKEGLNQIRRETEEHARKFEAEIEQIKQDWDRASADVPGKVLELFSKVAETYDGEALADVEIHDERIASYTCGGCFMGLTNETANLLMTRDEILRCPSCSRILVMRQMES